MNAPVAGSVPLPLASFDLPQTLFALPHLVALCVRGEDAISFLHNQLTTDIKGCALSSVHLSGLCNHKGRVLASPWVYRHADGIDLIVPRDIVARLLTHLKKFVLRAKVNLEESADTVVGGFRMMTNTEALSYCIALAGLPAQSRYLALAPANAPDTITNPSAVALWRMMGMAAQIPEIAAINQEQFIPQSINLDLLEAVNFKKGCYPGQEIVARTHYLSEAKRRAFFVTAASALTEGQSVTTAEGEEIGRVVNAQSLAQSHYGLIEIKIGYIEAPLFVATTPLQRQANRFT